VTDNRQSSDSDAVSDTLTPSVPTVSLLCADSVSIESGDSHRHPHPYQLLMQDDSTSVDRVSYSDMEGLLRGD